MIVITEECKVLVREFNVEDREYPHDSLESAAKAAIHYLQTEYSIDVYILTPDNGIIRKFSNRV